MLKITDAMPVKVSNTPITISDGLVNETQCIIGFPHTPVIAVGKRRIRRPRITTPADIAILSFLSSTNNKAAPTAAASIPTTSYAFAV